MKPLLRLASIGTLAAVFLPAAWATTPASGTLNATDKTSLSSETSAYAVQSAGSRCNAVPSSCDSYLLTVDLPTTYAASNPGDVIQIDLVPDNAATDLDMQLLDSSGAVLATSGLGAGKAEQMVVPAGSGLRTLNLQVLPFAAKGGSGKLSIKLVKGVAPVQTAEACPASGSVARLDAAVVSAFKSLASSAQYGAYLHFCSGDETERNALLKKHGLTTMVSFYPWAKSIFVQGPVAGFISAAKEPSISYLEANAPLKFMGDTEEWSTRTRVAQEAVSGGPYYDAAGKVLDGTGVTVSVVDSGLNATHPDFAGRVIHNYKVPGSNAVAGTPVVDVGYASSDTTGGHGTHCNGIAAGGGAASDPQYPMSAVAPLTNRGTYTGVAPKASLLAYGTGEAISILTADIAFKHILDNYDTFTPRVRVISNSYGNTGGTAYNPAATASTLAKALVDKGVSVVYAAGNDGGDGTVDKTAGACKNTTPGVICVASYNDNSEGNRNFPLSSFSARGKKGDPANYPDIAAPGQDYTATCAETFPGQEICTGSDNSGSAPDNRWLPYYGTISGTSMATPHVSGAIALLYQAKPLLSPAQVETMLQNTAIKVGPDYEADPQNPGGTINFGYGGGLMDFPTLLDTLGVKKAGLPTQGQEYTIFDGDTDGGTATDAVKLTFQEVAATSTTASGITVRITLGSATPAAATFQLRMNVAGHRAYSQVVLGTDGKVTVPASSETNTALASNAVLTGKVLSFFLPYNQLGYPAVTEPIYNIRVVVSTANGVVDRAPSPMGSNSSAPLANTTLGNMDQDLFPAFGRAFTIQLPAGLPPASTEKACVAPGLTMLTSPTGLTGNGLPTGQDDLRQAWFAEPETRPGKLVITLKMGNLSTVPPNYRWIMYFKVPGDVADYFVAMDTTQVTPRYIYGTRSTIDTPEASVGSFTTLGTLDTLSTYTADGTIQLVINKATWPKPITDGMVITGIAASIRQTTNSQNGVGLTVDSAAGPINGYTVVGNVCKAAVVTPTPVTPTPTPTEPNPAPTPTPVSTIGNAQVAPVVMSKDESSGRFGGALGLLLLPVFAGGALLRRRRSH